MYYAYAKTKTSKKYYFTGSGFDTLPFKLKKYSSIKALTNAVKPYANKLPAKFSLYSEKVKSKKKKTVKKVSKKKTTKRHAKNPVPKSKWNKLKEASRRFEEFTGHPAEFIDEKDLRKMDVAFSNRIVTGKLF